MALGIPYMGSKRKLAGDILHVITSRHPALTHFYDLFGGGGAVSFTAIKNYRFKVHYNELNSHIFKLVEYVKTNKELDPKFYEWVTREEFFKQINRPNSDADWWSGFVMSCWSFGNKQSSYIYGEDIEELKMLAHNFICFGDLDAMTKLGLNIPELNEIKGIQKRRVVFCSHIEQLIKQRCRLQNLQNLQISNFSYENVQIIGDNPVIYCDIPYKGTGEYKEGGFDYERFYQWVRDIDYPVYISEYDAPFQEVDAFTHRSSLSATNNKKKTIERIFWNGKGNITQTKLFDYDYSRDQAVNLL